MDHVNNLDDNRVCDNSNDGKVIEFRKKDCITRITTNADRTLKVTHEYEGIRQLGWVYYVGDNAKYFLQV